MLALAAVLVLAGVVPHRAFVGVETSVPGFSQTALQSLDSTVRRRFSGLVPDRGDGLAVGRTSTGTASVAHLRRFAALGFTSLLRVRLQPFGPECLLSASVVELSSRPVVSAAGAWSGECQESSIQAAGIDAVVEQIDQRVARRSRTPARLGSIDVSDALGQSDGRALEDFVLAGLAATTPIYLNRDAGGDESAMTCDPPGADRRAREFFAFWARRLGDRCLLGVSRQMCGQRKEAAQLQVAECAAPELGRRFRRMIELVTERDACSHDLNRRTGYVTLESNLVSTVYVVSRALGVTPLRTFALAAGCHSVAFFNEEQRVLSLKLIFVRPRTQTYYSVRLTDGPAPPVVAGAELPRLRSLAQDYLRSLRKCASPAAERLVNQYAEAFYSPEAMWNVARSASVALQLCPRITMPDL